MRHVRLSDQPSLAVVDPLSGCHIDRVQTCLISGLSDHAENFDLLIFAMIFIGLFGKYFKLYKYSW